MEKLREQYEKEVVPALMKKISIQIYNASSKA